MKIAIIDDEPLALNRLSRLLTELNYRFDPYHHVHDLLNQINPYDLYILDINMPQYNGLELARILNERHPESVILFQTAHDTYALNAYDVGAIDYLLKPYSKDRLEMSIEKAKHYLKQSQTIEFLTKNGDEYLLLRPEDIFYIQADLAQVIIRSAKGYHYYNQKISYMQTLLASHPFFKIHRSILINTTKIKSMKTLTQSKLSFSFDEIKEEITSSKEGAKLFRQHYKLSE
jgi:two-component system LytT family response regulator